MSGEDFDALTEALASRTISRRRALRLAAASALGAAGLGISAREAEARPRCPRRSGCSRRCRNTNGKVCFCIRTTEGRRVCVQPDCGESCERTTQCPEGHVCMRNSCCDGHTCVPRCTEPTASGATASGTAWS